MSAGGSLAPDGVRSGEDPPPGSSAGEGRATPGADTGAGDAGDAPTLDGAETPVGVVDRAVAAANARRVVAYCREHGLAWRPHVKTHKSTRMARLQLDAGARGLTVATPREAEVMARLTPDILLAYPPLGASKLARLMALPEGTDLKVALDSVEVLGGLATASSRAGRTSGVLVEADVGLGRVGVATADDVLELARAAVQLPGVDFRGVMFYPGHIRDRVDEQGPGLRALAERLAAILDTLEAAGFPPEIVSGGSTPTLWRSHEVPGLTEIRPGTTIFNDREQLAVGSARREDLAYSVLATVVSTAVPGRAVVDAGTKALDKEERGGDGYAALLDHPDVPVRALSEEHGVLDLGSTDWRPSVGERVRIVPNHVCVSVNLQDRLLVLDGAGDGEWWPLEGRGRGPWPGPSPAGDVPGSAHGTGR